VRLQRRTDHFAGATLLENQLAALEPPSDVLTFDATLSVDALVTRIRSRLGTGKVGLPRHVSPDAKRESPKPSRADHR
jgi:hypothetical protein